MTLLAISDLHVTEGENRRLVEGMRPESDEDWLILAGDVGIFVEEIEWALRTLKDRFATVLWMPGNHDLWTYPQDPCQLRGEERYMHLVDVCRGLGIATPEDPYLVWEGDGGPVTVVPLFLLYDYTFRPDGAATKDEAIAKARAAGVMCVDERLLHPDPHPSREAWCSARIAETERRLAALDPGTRTVLAGHYPLVRDPTFVLRYPEFAIWCGTDRTADWHRRFNAVAAIYGHLHIPRTTWHDGVRFEEVSVGYPREWGARSRPPAELRRILPAPES
ncbi:MAG: metallophosphoesterase family protein [Solirubrobacteraceae bacterium]